MARMADTLPAPAPYPAPGIDPMLPRVTRVRRRRRDGPDVWTLDFDADPAGRPAGAPGQFNMLTVFGVGEVPVSLSGDAAEPDRLVHTIRAVGPVSTALTRLGPGDPVGLRGPFGTGWPMAGMAGRDVVVLAGGLGLAPLRPALHALRSGQSPHDRAVLLYGARSPDGILFRREIDTWRRRGDLDIHVTVDHAPGDWAGHVGVVTSLLPRAAFDPLDCVALVCGPEIMMRAAIAALLHAGVAPEAIHLSMERNMKCAVGLCGRCQFGPVFVCQDGPVFRYDRVRDLLAVKEL